LVARVFLTTPFTEYGKIKTGFMILFSLCCSGCGCGT